MAKRRGHGEGSITRMADGRWQARVDLGYVDGKRKRKAIYGRTRKDVADQLKVALVVQQNGLLLGSNQQSVEQYLTHWLATTAKQTLRPRTHVRYEQLVRIHALPALGKLKLGKLTAQHLSALYAARLDAGSSPRTVQFLHAVLHRALKQAMRWELIPRNPADVVQAPRPIRHEMRALDPEQATKLLQAAEGDPLEALYVLALTAGLRMGELLGLTWDDLDGSTLQVRHTLQRIEKQWVLAEPKTARGRRSVTLTSRAVRALHQHKARQLEQKLQAGAAWQGGWNLIFCNAIGEPLDNSHLLNREFRPLLQRAGLPAMRLHDLRHSAASLLLAQGVHPKVVQEMLGHATIALTLDVYSHVLPNLQAEAAAKMDALLDGVVSRDA